jgi:chitin disaccharide deacetylase
MIILCADDYALTEGVSRAIGELAAARRLSATSVLVTRPHWPRLAPRLLVHRRHLSIGLHLNLTLGAPLAPMPKLAPKGEFPTLAQLTARAMLGLLNAAEVRGEVERQLDRFQAELGFPPDHIDGHQHVHVLPTVRRALLDAASRRYPQAPLVRDPADRVEAIRSRGRAVVKALTVKALATGLRGAAEVRGLPTNRGFSGFSNFSSDVPFSEEMADGLREPGTRHIFMCHPGHPDEELASVDPVVARRRMEYDALMADATLPTLIWRPSRSVDGPALDWRRI